MPFLSVFVRGLRQFQSRFDDDDFHLLIVHKS